jgi:predicted Abi (CAAX) family protease
MSSGGAPVWLAASLSSVRRLPDIRGAIEGFLLFLVVLGAAAWAATHGGLTLHPIPREDMSRLFWLIFLTPAFSEEMVFRSWLSRPNLTPAAIGLGAFILWHPLQYWLGSPFARPEFVQPVFLALVALLGVACTISRVRSGSIWPAVVIHWGIAVLWSTLFAGR